ncbi:uncharacterized protein LOC127710668 [Mytilus californianus]|uniref:uncharacterized protein LOC127710668 n=1 Tax=Mytilus californianus TaxID=6549 RepID=UPI002247AE54|nr:uncharacterized protein LOC127710668 [Mytilus californianus]XP_052072580.1 uncharacterized protein LOC127710668 [Mytilus californianus]XP_052072581.1 uncharacterized protein LOC127710668 [Mytilus californianus]
MESVKTPHILPNINREDFTRSHTQVFKQTIDNPRDHDLKRRQTLWSFQNRNRGVQRNLKGQDINESLSDADLDETNTTEDENKGKSQKRINFPRLKQRVKEAFASPVSDETSNVKREYSSALRIGTNLYEQLRIKQKLDKRNSFPKDRPLLKSVDKFPEVTSSLTKLSYLKAAKNVVHYGGGFFGRSSYADRRYMDFRRSQTMLSPSESKTGNSEPHLVKKPIYGSLKQLNLDDKKRFKCKTDIESCEVLKVSSHEISERGLEEHRTCHHSTQKRKFEKENENKSKKSKEDIIEIELLSEKYSIDFSKTYLEDLQQKPVDVSMEEDVIRNEAWQKDIDLIVARHDVETLNGRKTTKGNIMLTKASQTGKSDTSDGRPESNVSLDMPEDQFGPSSYKPDEGTHRLLNAAYCINPYKWTSRSSLTAGDRTWVEKAMERTDIIDTTIYDGFARKKSKSMIKNSDHLGKEKSTVSSKPP